MTKPPNREEVLTKQEAEKSLKGCALIVLVTVMTVIILFGIFAWMFRVWLVKV